MFKDRLKQLREENKLTQKELGDKIFVSRSAICKWEMGSGIPSDVNLKALCEFFNVEEEWLLDRDDMKVMVEKLSIDNKNKGLFILGICLPVIFTCISLLPIYTYNACGDGHMCIMVYVSPKSVFTCFGAFSVIPLVIYGYTFVFSIVTKIKYIKNTNLINFINILISVVVLIITIIVSYVLAINDGFTIGFINLI